MIKYKRYLFLIILLFFIFLLKVDAKTYEEYKLGDVVTYNGIKFYVIENSGEEQSYVTLLKQQPLTVDEVNTYGAGHVNVHISVDPTDYHPNGYGRIAYYTSETCGYDKDHHYSTEGCTTNYEQSEIKYVIDAWALDKFGVNDLMKDKMGYEARLLTFNELVDNFGYTLDGMGTVDVSSNESVSIWINGSNYDYWTMSQSEDSNSRVRVVSPGDEGIVDYLVTSTAFVRPVVNIKKDFITKEKKKTMLDSIFEIGDIVEYNGMDFYVLKESKQSDTTVTLLKKEP